MKDTNKKASREAINFCSKNCGSQLGLSSSWELLYEQLALKKNLACSIHSTTKSLGDTTTISLYRQGKFTKEFLINEWILPNSEYFDAERGSEWMTNKIHRLIVEYIIKNFKKIK